jgi:hypothetical protein
LNHKSIVLTGAAMQRIGIIFLLFLYLGLAFSGCTTREWYEGMQEQQRQDCYKYENRDEIQKCLDRVNSESYDRYQRERNASE